MGYFLNAGGAASVGIARYITPRADLARSGGVSEADGQLDSNDLIVFIHRFFSNDSRDDIGKVGGLQGSDGRLDNNDFIVFIDWFFTGC